MKSVMLGCLLALATCSELRLPMYQCNEEFDVLMSQVLYRPDCGGDSACTIYSYNTKAGFELTGLAYHGLALFSDERAPPPGLRRSVVLMVANGTEGIMMYSHSAGAKIMEAYFFYTNGILYNMIGINHAADVLAAGPLEEYMQHTRSLVDRRFTYLRSIHFRPNLPPEGESNMRGGIRMVDVVDAGPAQSERRDDSSIVIIDLDAAGEEIIVPDNDYEALCIPPSDLFVEIFSL